MKERIYRDQLKKFKELGDQAYEIYKLDQSDIDAVLSLQERELKRIENPTTYVPDTREMLEKSIRDGFLFGFYHQRELFGFRRVQMNRSEHAYWKTCAALPKELHKKVAILESTVIAKEYRGNSLQKVSLDVAKEELKKNGVEFLSCTISPENLASLINMLRANLHICNLDVFYRDEKYEINNVYRYVLFGPIDRMKKEYENIKVVRRMDYEQQRELLQNGYFGFFYDKEKDSIYFTKNLEKWGNYDLARKIT